MELGNMVFGNSRGEYSLVRGAGFEEAFQRLQDKLGMDDYCEEFENETFATFPYWWGGCECGFDELVDAEDKKWGRDHSLDCFGVRYQKEEDACCPPFGFKGREWDWKHKHMVEWAKANGYPEAPDGMAIHCDCGYAEALDEFYGELVERFGGEHKLDCPLVKPNFLYKPLSFQIQWYKYPFRDSYTNQEITLKAFGAIIGACMASLGKEE